MFQANLSLPELLNKKENITLHKRHSDVMLNTWREKFTTNKFALIEEEPEKFIICQWQLKNNPSIWYLIYRWLITIYFFTTWLLSILIVKKKTNGFQIKWLIYLTNWGYTACTFQAFLVTFMLSACVLAYRQKSYTSIRDRVLKAYGLYWATNTIATVVACSITIIYWSLIYDEKKNELDAMNFFLHAMNTAVMTLDFWIVSHPIRLAHCIYPIMFVFTYAIFSFIYYLAGGTSREGTDYIYPILKWRLPFKSLLVCAGVGVFVFVVHIFFYLMHLLRRRIHQKFGRFSSIELTNRSTDMKNEDGYVNEGVIVDQV